MAKRKTGIDYIKAYNKKIAKTKSKLTYVPIDIEAYKELTPSEKGQITKIIKKFDLRKEQQLIGSNVSINTNKLLKKLEQISNKRIAQFTGKFDDIKLKLGGVEQAEQAAESYKREAPLQTNINVKKLKERDIKRKAESFQKHFKKEFYDKRLASMKQEYIDLLNFQLAIQGTQYDVEGLLKYLRDLPDDEFYRLYLENIDMHIVFDSSPTTRKNMQIEAPLPDGDVLYESVANGSGYTEQLRDDTITEIKSILKGTPYDKKKLYEQLENMDLSNFFDKYMSDDITVDYQSPENTYNTILNTINEKR